MKRGPDPIIQGIEVEATRRSKAAREVYASKMRLLRRDYDKRERAIAAEEDEALQQIVWWRLTAIAAVRGEPTSLGDARSLKRARPADVVTDERGVSLPKLRCLTGGGT